DSPVALTPALRKHARTAMLRASGEACTIRAQSRSATPRARRSRITSMRTRCSGCAEMKSWKPKRKQKSQPHRLKNPAYRGGKEKKGRTMNPLTQFKKISILPLLIALGLVMRAPPAAAQANEVTNWNQIATTTLVTFPPRATGPALQINMAMTQGAVYDAVNAIEPRHYRPYLLRRRFAATAAYRVLSNIVSTVRAHILFSTRR